jgi:transposase-like protein
MNNAVNLIEFQDNFGTEQACIDYLAEARWGKEIVCPHCGSLGGYKFSNGKLFKCKECRKQFTVRIGTIFEESRIPLKKWFLAIYLLTSLKKGLSSVQLGKYVGVTQKTAWFMLQRIRYAISQDSFNAPLKNIVEADETYVGGKGRNNKRGRGAENKTPVAGIVERQGSVKCKPVENVSSNTLVPFIRNSVEIGASVMTDEFRSYNKLSESGYKHDKVQHAAKEYARDNVHTNTIEGFWSQLKRGINAIYVQVSPKHLNKYCDEYSYRYNSRELNDFERFGEWFDYCGKRLTYKTLIS